MGAFFFFISDKFLFDLSDSNFNLLIFLDPSLERLNLFHKSLTESFFFLKSINSFFRVFLLRLIFFSEIEINSDFSF